MGSVCCLETTSSSLCVYEPGVEQADVHARPRSEHNMVKKSTNIGDASSSAVRHLLYSGASLVTPTDISAGIRF